MLTISKWLLVVSGVLLIVDSILMFLGKPNPLGLPLPCPVTLTLLGLGTILFGLGSKAFEKPSRDLG